MSHTGRVTRAGLGIVSHTGWAWVVRVEGDRVAARVRVVALEVHAAELYHLTRDHDGDRARFLARGRAAALIATELAIRALADGAGAAIVLGKQPALPPLERIVAAHPVIHTAEGELWRGLFAEACAARGLAVERHVASELRAADAWLAREGKAIGPPWGSEPKAAALAARAATRGR